MVIRRRFAVLAALALVALVAAASWTILVSRRGTSIETTAAGPDPPGAITVVAGERNTVSWTVDPENEQDTYRVYRAPTSDGEYATIGTTKATTFVDEPSERGIHWYRVSAIGASGVEGPLSEPVSSDNVDLRLTLGPEGGILEPTTGTIRLDIPPGAVDAPTAFTIEQVTSPPAPEPGHVLVTRVFDIGPTGIAFDPRATLTLRYEIPQDLQGPAANDSGRVTTRFWDADTESWDSVGAQTVGGTSGSTVTARIPHLSLWAATYTLPHGGYTDETQLCAVCHASHNAASDSGLLSQPTEPEVCYQCHDGTGASTNIETEFGNGLRVSFHPVPAPAADGSRLVCSDCHAVHSDPTANPKLLYIQTGVDQFVLSDANVPIGNDFCYKCHGEGTTLPAPFGNHEAFDASVHNTSSKVNPSTPTTGVKCTACHEPHASDYRYLTTLGGEVLCFSCHTQLDPNTAQGSNPYNAFNGTPNDTTTTDGNGIRIYHHPVAAGEQAGGARQVECGSCHNSHLVDPNRPAADPALVQDKDSAWTFGWTDGTHTRASNASQYCAKCHVSPTTTAPLNASATVPYNVRLVNDTAADADGRAHDRFTWSWFSTGARSAHGNPAYTSTKYLACPPGQPCALACTACHDFHGSSNAYMLRERIVSPDYHPYAVSSATWSNTGGGTATLTIGQHGLAKDFTVIVTNVTPAGYNGTFTVSSVTATTISYKVANPGSSGTGGSVEPRGVSGQAYTATISGFTGLNTPADRATLQAFCLTCHLERDATHQSGKLCTECHSHDPSTLREF